MGAGKRDGLGVELLAQCRQGGGAMRRRLSGDGHPQFALGNLQPRRRLEGGVKQRAAFLAGPGIVVLEHPQQFRLHLVGGHLDRIRDELLLRLQRLQVVGRNPLGRLGTLFQQPLDLAPRPSGVAGGVRHARS